MRQLKTACRREEKFCNKATPPIANNEPTLLHQCSLIKPACASDASHCGMLQYMAGPPNALSRPPNGLVSRYKPLHLSGDVNR